VGTRKRGNTIELRQGTVGRDGFLGLFGFQVGWLARG